MTPDEFLSKLRAYCAHFRASVTSYGRTHAHNLAMGGVRYSGHLLWVAADVVYDGAPDLDDRRALARALGLVVVVEGDHDHLEPVDYSP